MNTTLTKAGEKHLLEAEIRRLKMHRDRLMAAIHAVIREDSGLMCIEQCHAALLNEDVDPSPYCSYGHKTAKSCDCGPIAKND